MTVIAIPLIRSDVDWRKVGHTVGFLALVAAVALFGVVALPGLVGADHTYVVYSDSMSPAIEAGSVVFVNEVSADQVEAGAVVTYQSDAAGQNVVTHRVEQVRETGDERRFRTKGDANEEPDPEPVGPAQLIGVVTFTVPMIGYVVSFAETDAGLLVLVVGPALLLIGLELRDLRSKAVVSADRDEEVDESG